MPIVPSSYSASGLFKNGHFSTIYSAKLRPNPSLVQHRERMSLSDGDFLDLDFSYAQPSSQSLAILLHGLEGNAQRTYIKGQGKWCIRQGWDVCAVNYRGCSGEDNLMYPSYNAGKSDDLHEIVQYILEKDHYKQIALIGFSLGGNLLIKYLGEQTPPKQITHGIAISAPLHLEGSLSRLTEGQNWVYRTSFLYHLRKKYRIKMDRFPEKMSVEELKQMKSLLEFDHRYTAPAHGFKDAYDYYDQSSSIGFLPSVPVPVLILNALNDTFLSPKCYPRELATGSKNIYLETSKHGGHVGFHQSNSRYYSERRAIEFLKDLQ